MLIEITMYVVWATVALLAVVLEVQSEIQLGWAGVLGAIGALIAHAITKGNPIWIEIVVFIIILIIFWVLLFGIFAKNRKKNLKLQDGYMSFIGQDYLAFQSNQNQYGELKINDKIFRFKSKDKIKKGDTVKVISITGVTFIVKKINKTWSSSE